MYFLVKNLGKFSQYFPLKMKDVAKGGPCIVSLVKNNFFIFYDVITS
jgi:hypothetical protein